MERKKSSNTIKMKSLTHAMRARDILAKKGIHSTLVRTKGGEQGCGYSLYIPDSFNRARTLLSSFGLETDGGA